MQVHRASLLEALKNPAQNIPAYCQWFLRHHTLTLNGPQRIGLVGNQGAGNLQDDPVSSFQILFREDSVRATVRKLVFEAFGKYLVVDPTNLGSLGLRLSDRAPSTTLEERGVHQEAVDFHAAALPIDQASDGVKAFVGMLIEILTGNPEVLLVDEPEAFLHPSLAFSLGKEVSQLSQGSGKRLFVSTHSAPFVMGCIQSGAPVNIVRLTYRDGVATARVLPKDDLLHLMRNPLLRSAGVISALFYENVVITEGDADRAFYQEINERLLRFTDGRGIGNCLFLNAQNKQTVQTIIRPLRKLGIPAAGIVDVDILKEGGAVWAAMAESLSIPQIERQSLAVLRQSVHQRLEETKKNYKRDGGFALLSGADLEAANNLADHLARYGMFMLRKGELESWLKHLEVAGHGPSWLVKVFESMGEDYSDARYMMPKSDDVWHFVDSLKAWLADPHRKGIPT